MTLPDRVVVVVTDEDIQRGQQMNCLLCPISLAAARALHVRTASSLDTIMVYVDGLIVSYDMPIEATDWMTSFDADGDVGPIQFAISKAQS